MGDLYSSVPADLATAQAAIGVRPYFRNFKPSNTKRLRVAAAGARTGTAFCTIGCVGDSTARGTCNSIGNQQAKNAWPSQLANRLQSAGFTAKWQSFFGGASAADPVNADDDRVTFSGGMTLASNVFTLGGAMLAASSAGSVTFAPPGSLDTFDIYYVRNTGLGTFSYAVDGGSASNVSAAGAQGIQKQTISAAVGTHALTIAWVSGQIYIIGIDAYNSAAKGFKVWNFGWPGARTTELIQATAAWTYLNALQYMVPSVVIIDIGINQWRLSGANPASVYKTELDTLVQAARVNSDVILKTPRPSATSVVSLAIQQTYVDAMYEIAATYDLPVMDAWRRIGAAEDYPAMYDDTLHGNIIGYNDDGEFAYQALMLAA